VCYTGYNTFKEQRDNPAIRMKNECLDTGFGSINSPTIAGMTLTVYFQDNNYDFPFPFCNNIVYQTGVTAFFRNDTDITLSFPWIRYINKQSDILKEPVPTPLYRTNSYRPTDPHQSTKSQTTMFRLLKTLPFFLYFVPPASGQEKTNAR
jgi:hypothetical protein